jgi:hypothetical protein
MIIIYLYQHPGTTLLIGFLLGTTDMFLIAIARTRIARALARRRKRRAKARQEAAALQAHEEAPIEVEDDRIACPLCWEGRHPGQHWPFRRYIACRDHLIACLPIVAEAPIQYLEKYASTRL